MPVLMLIVSYIPALLIFLYFRSLRKDDAEYRKDLNELILKGAISSFPILGLSFVFNILLKLTGVQAKYPLLGTALHDFIVLALSEEIVKFVTGNKIVKKNEAKNNWQDIIVYMSMAAFGFELLESLVYMFTTNTMQILVRGITAMHVSMAMFVGYFYGKSKYTGNKFWLVFGFVMMWIVHGSFDFLLSPEMEEYGYIAVFLAIWSLINMIVTVVIVAKGRKQEKYTKPFSEM